MLREVPAFGANPGQLRLLCHIPTGLPANAPLVVALHGCQQDAEGFVRGTGWATVADRHGFAVLAPDQRQQNNANRCFNWFEPADQARHGGEAESIAAMVTHLLAAHRLDARRVFVTGLSAGGAMTAVLLATHPELFAGGAIVAGLPYGVAASVPEAFAAMRGDGIGAAKTLAARVRAASSHRGPFPRVAIWHGTADTTVVPANADALAAQWVALHGVTNPGERRDVAPRHRLTTWRGQDGTVVVERHDIAGLPHGVPIATADCGEAAPFILDVGIASTGMIAAFFGVAPPVALPAAATQGVHSGTHPGVIAVGRDGTAQASAGGGRAAPSHDAEGSTWAAGAKFADETIRRALAAAGLAKP